MKLLALVPEIPVGFSPLRALSQPGSRPPPGGSPQCMAGTVAHSGVVCQGGRPGDLFSAGLDKRGANPYNEDIDK